ncbi:methionine biosynthesis protein MetW [Sphingoaurantiacus capsulatus]|uniref:Methionine biosynthesis protein MetW n=1 Tax=Sphingoaurantiacus capsulatus TaxID=1771310 RepID=A0ABV7X689_9SPHN
MTLRPDLAAIAEIVPAGARVLDVGCGDGALMAALRDEKGVDARGIEISREGVAAAVGRGLSVVQGDADTDLVDYPADAFDYAILSQTLQATRAPHQVLDQLLRIGRHAIVSFPNFAYWRVRMALMFGGRMPMTRALPVTWYETQNIHFCTVDDFRALIVEKRLVTERERFLSHGRPRGAAFANLMAEQAIFVLRR